MGKPSKKYILVNIIITLIAIILSSSLTYIFTKHSEKETRIYHANREALRTMLPNVWKYNNYYTVDWLELKGVTHSSTPCRPEIGEVDYDAELAKIHNIPNPCIQFNLIRNAKFDFRKLTIEARLIGSNNIVRALDEIEDGFDQVLKDYINKDYYLRSFIDTYNETMVLRFERLENLIREDLNK